MSESCAQSRLIMESLLERLAVEIAEEFDETVDDPFVSSSDEESSSSAWFGPSWD